MPGESLLLDPRALPNGLVLPSDVSRTKSLTFMTETEQRPDDKDALSYLKNVVGIPKTDIQERTDASGRSSFYVAAFPLDYVDFGDVETQAVSQDRIREYEQKLEEGVERSDYPEASLTDLQRSGEKEKLEGLDGIHRAGAARNHGDETMPLLVSAYGRWRTGERKAESHRDHIAFTLARSMLSTETHLELVLPADIADALGWEEVMMLAGSAGNEHDIDPADIYAARFIANATTSMWVTDEHDFERPYANEEEFLSDITEYGSLPAFVLSNIRMYSRGTVQFTTRELAWIMQYSDNPKSWKKTPSKDPKTDLMRRIANGEGPPSGRTREHWMGWIKREVNGDATSEAGQATSAVPPSKKVPASRGTTRASSTTPAPAGRTNKGATPTKTSSQPTTGAGRDVTQEPKDRGLSPKDDKKNRDDAGKTPESSSVAAAHLVRGELAKTIAATHDLRTALSTLTDEDWRSIRSITDEDPKEQLKIGGRAANLAQILAECIRLLQANGVDIRRTPMPQKIE